MFFFENSSFIKHTLRHDRMNAFQAFGWNWVYNLFQKMRSDTLKFNSAKSFEETRARNFVWISLKNVNQKCFCKNPPWLKTVAWNVEMILVINLKKHCGIFVTESWYLNNSMLSEASYTCIMPPLLVGSSPPPTFRYGSGGWRRGLSGVQSEDCLWDLGQEASRRGCQGRRVQHHRKTSDQLTFLLTPLSLPLSPRPFSFQVNKFAFQVNALGTRLGMLLQAKQFPLAVHLKRKFRSLEMKTVFYHQVHEQSLSLGDYKMESFVIVQNWFGISFIFAAYGRQNE